MGLNLAVEVGFWAVGRLEQVYKFIFGGYSDLITPNTMATL